MTEKFSATGMDVIFDDNVIRRPFGIVRWRNGVLEQLWECEGRGEYTLDGASGWNEWHAVETVRPEQGKFG